MSWVGDLLLGPFALLPTSKLGAAVLLILVVLLTIATQIGGLVLWLGLPILRRLYRFFRPRRFWLAWGIVLSAFGAVYLVVSLVLVPPVAALFGRVALPCLTDGQHAYRAASALYCLANRNYAVPEIQSLLAALSDHLAARYPGTEVRYLDAGFPFFDGFPLLPHLSHHNGRKIDLAFFYADSISGAPLPSGAAWPVGYWAYSGPEPDEPRPCAGVQGWVTLRWDFDWLQPAFAGRTLDDARTAAMVAWLAGEDGALHGVRKVLLEPHLKARLGLESPMVRFQGCRAARHDDHLHLQLD